MTDQSVVARRREQRRERQVASTAQAMAQPVNNLPVYELVGEDALHQINDTSMLILEEIGIDFYDEEALAVLGAQGAVVKGSTVFFDRKLIAEYVGKAPAQFTQLARNPQRNVVIGGKHVTFAPVYGPPYVYDLVRGRREATLRDFENFVKLAYLSPYIHHSGGTVVEPTDLPTHTRHLDMLDSHIRYSDKPFMGSVTSGPNAEDSVRMAEFVFGAEAIRQQPALLSLINISSPRRLDDRMLSALKVYAKARQAMIITPFILSGAMAPAAVGTTHVVCIDVERTPTQHTRPVTFQRFAFLPPSFIRRVRVLLIEATCPLPDIATHLLNAIRTNPARKTADCTCVANLRVSVIETVGVNAITPWVSTAIRTTCRLFPFGFAGQRDFAALLQ